MIGRVLIVGLLAGVLAGVIVSLFQMQRVAPLILEAETYEFAGDTASGDTAVVPSADDEAWGPAEGLERTAFTWLANILVGVGYGLVLVAGFVLSRRRIDWRQGLLWGLAGFAAFALMPGLVLPPEVPGAAAAALELRQVIWVATALATALGIALFAFGKNWPMRLAGVVLFVGPTLFGAPHGEGQGLVPPELAAEFVAVSFGAAVIFWLALGGISGYLYKRMMPA